jgi:malate dehydrogenase (oxaloacetate-decarboxylating)
MTDCFRLIDKPGLLTSETEGVTDSQKIFTKDASEWKDKDTDLLSVIKEVRPNVLIGTSTKPGAFTEDIIRAMAEHHERPIVLPLSNPTRLHEAKPEDILKWTDGKALVATGSPFPAVKGPWGDDGSEITIKVGECNNSVVFPGIGLGCVLSRSKHLTDRMLVAAVEGVSSMSPVLKDSTAPLLPDVSSVRDVSVRIARNVIQAAVKDGEATQEGIPEKDEDLEDWIKEQMWDPEYRPLKKVDLDSATREARGELKKAGTVHRSGHT